MKIKVNKYILKNSKLKKNTDILVISDIHSNIKALNKILKFLKNNKIDYILIPGDIVDVNNRKDEDLFLEKIKELAKYANTYMSLGNHDKYIDNGHGTMIDKKDYNKYKLFNYFNNTKNITLFKDEVNSLELDNNITINSINIPNKCYKSKENKELFDTFIKDIDKKEKIDSNKFNIFLIHSPNNLIYSKEIINYSKTINKANLILCGHNHGGLVHPLIQDIFKNHYGFVGPFNHFIQKNAYGIYNSNNKSLLISNGVTKLSDSASLKKIHKLVNKILIPEIDLIRLENGNIQEFKLIERKKV